MNITLSEQVMLKVSFCSQIYLATQKVPFEIFNTNCTCKTISNGGPKMGPFYSQDQDQDPEPDFGHHWQAIKTVEIAKERYKIDCIWKLA